MSVKLLKDNIPTIDLFNTHNTSKIRTLKMNGHKYHCIKNTR